MQELKRAIFLKGVYDPADASRITTTLYRPKHDDLRLEDGLVRSGFLLVPLTNVVELQVLAEAKPDVPTSEQVIESINAGMAEALEAAQDDGPKRRGRPRKNP